MRLRIFTEPGMWEAPPGERFDFHSKHYTVVDSPALPKPYADRPPLIIGGGGSKRTPRIAARYADEFNSTFRSPAETAEAFGRVRAVCEAQGRIRPLALSAAQELACGRTDAEVAARVEASGKSVAELREKGLAGSPAEIVDRIGRFSEIGCSRLYLRVLDLHDLDHLELVATAVKDAL